MARTQLHGRYNVRIDSTHYQRSEIFGQIFSQFDLISVRSPGTDLEPGGPKRELGRGSAGHLRSVRGRRAAVPARDLAQGLGKLPGQAALRASPGGQVPPQGELHDRHRVGARAEQVVHLSAPRDRAGEVERAGV